MRKKASQFLIWVLSAAVCLCSSLKPAEAAEVTDQTSEEIQRMRKEIQDLQEKVEHLDKHLIHRPETQENVRFFDGLKIVLGLTGILQGSSGADDLAGRDQTDASGSLDLEVQSVIGNHGTVFLLAESRQGTGLNDDIETFHGINADAVEDESALKLTEAWYEHAFSDGHLLFTLGKVDLTNYFDSNAVANDEKLQFMSHGFVNNIAVEFPEDNGPGLRLAYLPAEHMEIGLGLGESDADFGDVTRGAFGILEFIYKHQWLDLEGSYRFYAWTNRSNHTEWEDPLHDHEKNRGLGVSLDQAFNPGFTGFLRAGLQDKSVSQVDLAVSLGFEWRGPLSGRDKDVLALAVGLARLSEDYENSAAPMDSGDEQMVEVYYTFYVNDHLRISPDIQVIRNPAGLAGADTVTILGVRAQVLF